jgi:hypothetical protein
VTPGRATPAIRSPFAQGRYMGRFMGSTLGLAPMRAADEPGRVRRHNYVIPLTFSSRDPPTCGSGRFMESTVRGLRPVCEGSNFEVVFGPQRAKTRFVQDVRIGQHARELLRSPFARWRLPRDHELIPIFCRVRDIKSESTDGPDERFMESRLFLPGLLSGHEPRERSGWACAPVPSHPSPRPSPVEGRRRPLGALASLLEPLGALSVQGQNRDVAGAGFKCWTGRRKASLSPQRGEG